MSYLIYHVFIYYTSVIQKRSFSLTSRVNIDCQKKKDSRAVSRSFQEKL